METLGLLRNSEATNPLREFRCTLLAAILTVGPGAFVGQVRADAMVVTKAMQASTIAEVFIDVRGVRVELEIAPEDFEAFADLLPDELYATLDEGNLPMAERRQRFLGDGLVLRDEHDRRLAGSVEHAEIRRRIVRDDVSGEPLPAQPPDTELVLDVVLWYVFGEKPTRLAITPPLLDDSEISAANIGFVCYHDGLPVNDFRYLSGKVTLDLDWSDPWYSHFRHPNLRRQFDAPMSAYLYVEPYEVRKEIILRPRDLQSWVDLGLGDSDVIPVDRQAELKERVAEFLSTKNPVMIDGRAAEGRLDRIHFIHRTLRTTGIVEPPVELDATSATLGVIFVYPIAKLPDEVSMTWELFGLNIQEVPAVASDEAGGLPSRLTPSGAVLTWQNFLTSPTTPGLVTIVRPTSRSGISVPVISAVCGGAMVVVLVIMVRQWMIGHAAARRPLVMMVAILACGVVTWRFARVRVTNPLSEAPGISDVQAPELMAGLLYNVYRAFDHHDESLIYDRLSQSIAGDLLGEVYLDTRRSMEVKNQGGLRVSVKDVTISELTALDETDESALSFRCRWRVAGWIGHWGHIHRRVNEHLAHVTLSPLDDRWKITAIDMLDEQTVESPQATAASRQAGSE